MICARDSCRQAEGERIFRRVYGENTRSREKGRVASKFHYV